MMNWAMCQGVKIDGNNANIIVASDTVPVPTFNKKLLFLKSVSVFRFVEKFFLKLPLGIQR
jgi:hypothetical protein